MTNLDNVATTIEKTDGLARKIWLAGLGAYVKSFEEIQNQYEKINGDRARLFNELVARGQKLMPEANANAEEEAKEPTAVEKRVAEVRIKLGLDVSDDDAKTAELTQKVEELTAQLNKLS
jgi:hypothetical protein